MDMLMVFELDEIGVFDDLLISQSRDLVRTIIEYYLADRTFSLDFSCYTEDFSVYICDILERSGKIDEITEDHLEKVITMGGFILLDFIKHIRDIKPQGIFKLVPSSPTGNVLVIQSAVMP